MEKLKIANKELASRLFIGTGKFGSNKIMEKAVVASGSELVTVSLKRVDVKNEDDDMIKHLKKPGINILPNTSGVRTAKEAVFAAQLAREALDTNWLKLEIHPDPKYLLPDPDETLLATKELVKLGFVVLPYVQADPVLCKKLEEGGLTLDESLAHFEKGIKLARFLRGELEKAEKRIEILLKDEKGEIKEEPFDPEKEEPSGSGEDNNLPF